MSNNRSLLLGGIAIELQRKRVKRLNVRVYPPDGRVCVSAPVHLSHSVIEQALLSKLDWIRHQQQRACRPVPPRQHIVTGEYHPVAGEQLLLTVFDSVQGRARIERPDAQALHLFCPASTTLERRIALLNDWYRHQLHGRIPALIEKWQPILRVQVAQYAIRHMRTRWGSCNTSTRRICLNLELAKYPPACLEYVLVHEMVHLLEPGHNQRFYTLMGQVLPDGQQQKEILKSGMDHGLP
ncbi:MAG: M48 family metallopeptidase [Desulfuromonadaceae bacterium]|nr:M48 family metallopeptidase [Desulfuromonadaceae bacterium]